MRAGHRPAMAVLVVSLVAMTAACGDEQTPTTAMAVVDTWIASISTGDVAATRDGLGPTSRAAIEQMVEGVDGDRVRVSAAPEGTVPCGDRGTTNLAA